MPSGQGKIENVRRTNETFCTQTESYKVVILFINRSFENAVLQACWK